MKKREQLKHIKKPKQFLKYSAGEIFKLYLYKYSLKSLVQNDMQWFI